MKKYLILAALLVCAAFGQLRFSAGAFYGDIAMTSMSNDVLLGSLPAGAIITGVTVGQSVIVTNAGTFTNSIYLNTKTVSGYFGGPVTCPLATTISVATSLSNTFKVLSASTPTAIYGNLVRLGPAVSLGGTYRVAIHYIQK
jgi:hypothetical protein